jgi:hypothetical protein
MHRARDARLQQRARQACLHCRALRGSVGASRRTRREEDEMAEEHDDGPVEGQDVLRSLEDVRSRLRTTIWALHGMHQDMSALTVEDLADLEHLLTETLDHLLSPAYEAVSQMLGVSSGGAVTTH